MVVLSARVRRPIVSCTVCGVNHRPGTKIQLAHAAQRPSREKALRKLGKTYRKASWFSVLVALVCLFPRRMAASVVGLAIGVLVLALAWRLSQ